MAVRSVSAAAPLALGAFALGALLCGPAGAQSLSSDNLTRIEQDGDANAALIEQTGAGNVAGTDAQPVFQQGVRNDLTILQTGTGNSVGTTGAALLQTGTQGGAPGLNAARIVQDGDDNRVDAVVQQILGAVPGDGNRLEVLQNGGPGTGGNVVALIRQTQETGMPGQSALLVMDGTGNRIEQVVQDSLSDLRGEENRITVSITGINNGTQALRGVAQFAGLAASHLVQTAGTEDTLANGNVIELTIEASGSAFSIRQRGRGNQTGPVVLTGDGNAIGIDQDGLDNDLSVGLIEGADNEIGLSQYGTNRASLSLPGESGRNSALIDQMGTNAATAAIEGDGNILSVRQGYLAGLGGTNAADLAVTGDRNRSDVQQEGTANMVSLRLEGDVNNLDAAFGAAAISGAMSPGEIVQLGAQNMLSGMVRGDANNTAALQQGDLNVIMLAVDGDENEALLRQIGNGNAAGLSQTGHSNVAVFLQ